MIKEYFSYLKDNPRGYWFKRKIFGFGWTPARWQGFLVLFLYIVSVFLVLIASFGKITQEKQLFIWVIFPIFILTIALIFICYKKGESLKWQWGYNTKK